MNPCCPICGKLLFPDEPFDGFNDWFACKNPKCGCFNSKFRKANLKRMCKKMKYERITKRNLEVVLDAVRIDDVGITQEQFKIVKERIFFILESLWVEV